MHPVLLLARILARIMLRNMEVRALNPVVILLLVAQLAIVQRAVQAVYPLTMLLDKLSQRELE